MNTPQCTVVSGYDRSQVSEEAVRVAVSVASAARHGELHLVYVPPIPVVASMATPSFLVQESIADAREELLGLARRSNVPENVTVSLHIAAGDAAQVLVEVAVDVEANLIVVGTHGRTGVGRLLLGSVAEQVVRKAPCSVLTVRPPRPTAAESIEPPCPDCVAAAASARPDEPRPRCARHTRRRPRAHTYREDPPTFGLGSLTLRFP